MPGDKSISHRSIMLGSIAEGVTRVSGFLEGEDSLATLNAFRDMGVQIERNGSNVVIHGVGMRGLKEPKNPLNLGNSGTSVRFLLPILALSTSVHHEQFRYTTSKAENSLTTRKRQSQTRNSYYRLDGDMDNNALDVTEERMIFDNLWAHFWPSRNNRNVTGLSRVMSYLLEEAYPTRLEFQRQVEKIERDSPLLGKQCFE